MDSARRRPTFDFRGSTALVTGGSRGIGKAVATALAVAGADVVITSRDAGAAASAAGDIAAEVGSGGGRVVPSTLELTDHAGMPAFVQQVTADVGPIDLLVNNAAPRPSLSPPGAVGSEALSEHLLGSAAGHFLLSCEVAKAKAPDSPLAIVNVSSVVGHDGAGMLAAYAMAKAAIVNMTRTLAKEWAAQGVRVNSVSIGPVETDLLGHLEAQFPGYSEYAASAALLKRNAHPDEAADPVLFLLSDGASYITGADVSVSGGCLLR